MRILAAHWLLMVFLHSRPHIWQGLRGHFTSVRTEKGIGRINNDSYRVQEAKQKVSLHRRGPSKEKKKKTPLYLEPFLYTFRFWLEFTTYVKFGHTQVYKKNIILYTKNILIL